MRKIEVGQKIENMVFQGDGIKFDMDDSGGVLLLSMSRPSHEEIESVKGDLKLALTEKNGCLFILVKFGSMDWMDAPYHVQLSKNLTKLQPLEEGMGYSCNIILYDETCTVRVLRLIGFSTKFSRLLERKILDQMEDVSFDLGKYNSTINQIYANYSTNDLLKYAEIKYSLK